MWEKLVGKWNMGRSFSIVHVVKFLGESFCKLNCKNNLFVIVVMMAFIQGYNNNFNLITCMCNITQISCSPTNNLTAPW